MGSHLAQETAMKGFIGIAALAGSLALAPSARAALSDADATALQAKYSCGACHTVANKVVGPSYTDVARKYKGDASAPAKLAAKVKAGGSGVWGPIPMPPNNVPDADLKNLVEWVLSRG
jgi:cytochrome c